MTGNLPQIELGLKLVGREFAEEKIGRDFKQEGLENALEALNMREAFSLPVANASGEIVAECKILTGDPSSEYLTIFLSICKKEAERLLECALDRYVVKIIIEYKKDGTLVSTAQCDHCPTKEFPYGGELGWVAGDPYHKGKGLGMAVCVAAVNRFIKAGYHNIYLQTDDQRLAALKIYLKLGFLPLQKTNEMKKRWNNVFNKLRIKIEAYHILIP